MILLLVFLAAISLIFVFITNHKKHDTIHLPPGPKRLPVIGNLHQFDPSAPHLYLSKLKETYGPILSLRLGGASVVVIQSAKLAEEVLKIQDLNFCNRPPMFGQQKLSYNGLDIAFNPYNSYSIEIRKICVTQLFSSKKVKSTSSIRRDEILRLINKISSLSSKSKVVNLSNLLMALTSSIICRIAFGKRYEDEGVERSRFHSLLNEAQAMLGAFFFSDYFPSMGWVDKLTGLSSRLDKAFNELDQFYDEILNEHLDPNKPKSDQEQDIVDVLLQLRKENCSAFEITLDHIKAVLMDIIVAGTDTSASMVVWAMTELIKNPETMNKVQDEIRMKFPGKHFIEEDDLPQLKYFKAVVKETFRFHPGTPILIARQALQKCSIEAYDIAPKTIVFVNVWAIGRDPKIWNDPGNFMPERFLGSSVDFKGNDFELIPFGGGRRMCPGMLLGIANFELALANLLSSFDWELPNGVKKEDIDCDVIPGITMHKKNPLCLVAKKSS